MQLQCTYAPHKQYKILPLASAGPEPFSLSSPEQYPLQNIRFGMQRKYIFAPTKKDT